jgi:hypothetical protein
MGVLQLYKPIIWTLSYMLGRVMNRSLMNMGKKGGGVGLLQPDTRETQKAGRKFPVTPPLYWRELLL